MNAQISRPLIYIPILFFLSTITARTQFYFSTNTDGSLNIVNYLGSGGVVVIPDTTNGQPIVSIEPYAFRFRPVTNIIIGNNITSIGSSAFQYDTGLTNATLGQQVGVVGSAAFSGCTGLKTVTLDTNLSDIGANAFYQCSMTAIVIPDSTTNVETGAFWDCTNAGSIIIGNGVTAIGATAFQSCTALTNLIIGTNVSNIGFSAFGHDPNLKSVSVPDNVVSLAGDGFYGCTDLTNVVIGNGVSNLLMNTFFECSSLATVTFGTNLTNITSSTFVNCTALTALYFAGNAPTVNSNELRYLNNAVVYYLPWTTGWTATFAGVPTAPWLPQAAGAGLAYGANTNRFGFNISWASGQTVVVETCTDLSNPVWSALATNIISSGSSFFNDPGWLNYPSRYYRMHSP
jgi:hypothetical protein